MQLNQSPPLRSPGDNPSGALLAIEAIGDIIEFWGFKRALGRIWTLLYLSSESLSAAEIGESLKLSAGSVSMTLNEMEQWGIIHRESRQGERQYFYRAETRLWQMIGRVIRQRELHQLDRLIHTLKDAIDMLAHSTHPAGPFAADRLRKLLALVESGTEVFKLVFVEQNWDLAAFGRLSQIRQLFQRH